MRTYAVSLLVVILVAGIAASGVGADKVMINNYGVTPFVYGGYSYIPLKSAADFVGAALLWDSLHNRATITYGGHQLGLVVGSTTAYYGGRTVVLPVAPIMVRDHLLVPTVVLSRYLEVPVRWRGREDELEIKGRPGWGYYRVSPSPPPYAIAVIERHGPPPWAPAHGYRRQHAYDPQVYVPAPFIYGGATYIPLRNATQIIGAALLWDSLRNRAAFTYNGHEIGLVIGSRTVYYGPQVIVLPAAPIVVHDVVYVPEALFTRHLHVPIEHSGHVLKVKGKRGWKEMRIVSAPPARFISRGARPAKPIPPGQARKLGRAGGPSARSASGPAAAHGRGQAKKAKQGGPGLKGGGRGRGAGGGESRGQSRGGKGGDKGGGRGHGKGHGRK
jgi:hypothetical protein